MAYTVVFVHAHPDDEALLTSGTMATLVQQGHRVVLVVATDGAAGLADVHAQRRDLAAVRHNELEASARVLGVDEVYWLGYGDSGLNAEVLPQPDAPMPLVYAPREEVVGRLAAILRNEAAAVVIGYDQNGGYGHPDHIQAHRVAMYAMQLAAVESFMPELGAPWAITKVYWTAFPKSVMRAGIEKLRELGDESQFAAMDPDDLPFTCPDEYVTTEIHAVAYLDRKLAAMRAHATQIDVQGGFFALSNNLGSEAMGTEYFRGVRGVTTTDGRETDLFAGIA